MQPQYPHAISSVNTGSQNSIMMMAMNPHEHGTLCQAHPLQPQLVYLSDGGLPSNSSTFYQTHVPSQQCPQLSGGQVVWVPVQGGGVVPMYALPSQQQQQFLILQQPTSAVPQQLIAPVTQLSNAALQHVTTAQTHHASSASAHGHTQAGVSQQCQNVMLVASGNGIVGGSQPKTLQSPLGTSINTHSANGYGCIAGLSEHRVVEHAMSHGVDVSQLTLENQITILASKVEAHIIENVNEGSMRSLTLSLALKQQEPELTKSVMLHFEHSWHRFVQHCANLSVFYYRDVDIERLGLQGYAEEHEARIRVARFSNQQCEQKDVAIVRHQQYHAELATVSAILLIRDAPSGVIELSELRTYLNQQNPTFFTEMTRSAFKRLLTRVPKTPIWISGNYIKLRRYFSLVPWAKSLTFTSENALEPMTFAHQMVARVALPSSTATHEHEVHSDDNEEDAMCTVENINQSTETVPASPNKSAALWSHPNLMNVNPTPPTITEPQNQKLFLDTSNERTTTAVSNEMVEDVARVWKDGLGSNQMLCGDSTGMLLTRSTNNSITSTFSLC